MLASSQHRLVILCSQSGFPRRAWEVLRRVHPNSWMGNNERAVKRAESLGGLSGEAAGYRGGGKTFKPGGCLPLRAKICAGRDGEGRREKACSR